MKGARMGVMQRLAFWRPTERKGANINDLLRELYNAPPSKSGQMVSWKSALNVTTVLACVRVLAEGVAQVPFKTFRETQDGRGREPARDHWSYNLLSYKPNQWQTSFEFREQIMTHLALCSNAFIFKNRVGNKIVELLPFEPQTVTVERRDDYSIKYTVTMPNRQPVVIPPEDMWHIPGLSWNGYFGMEAVKMAREAIGLGMAGEETEARSFKQGTRLSGVLKHPGKLTDEAAKRLRESWEANYSGSGNAGKTGLLEEGMDFTQISQTHTDAQMLELRGFQVEEICRAFRVLPIMVGRADKAATYASAEQMFLAHVVHTLTPWYARIEMSADKALLDGEAGVFAKFMPQGLMRGDARTRADFYAKLYAVGAISPNEVRGFEDMNPYDGGDEYRVPLNMVEPGAETPVDDGAPKPPPEDDKE